MTKKKAQEKYVELHLMQQQLEQIQKYLEELEQKQEEFEQAKETIKQLNRISTNEAFMPVAQGIFAKARIEETSQLLVNVGANIAVSKDVPKVLELLDTQIKEVREIRTQLEGNVVKLTTRMEATLEEVRNVSE